MPEFIRLPSSIINLSQIREIEFEGDVILIHWSNHRNHLILRGADAEALCRGLEKRYGLMSDAAALWTDTAA